MKTPISLNERSDANANLVKKINSEKEDKYYTCTIHNMYYSVYQKMKFLLCEKGCCKITAKIRHGDIQKLCCTCIQNIDTSADLKKLSKLSRLYNARLQYDYNDCRLLDDNAYNDYYSIMEEVNIFLDKYINL